MAEYIERQTVVDMLQNLSYDDWNQGVSTTWANAFSECAEMIRDIPPADVRPVVLCGDCRWFIDTGYTGIGLDIPELRTGHCRALGRDVHACWFCGAGEQKEDANSLTEALKRNTTKIVEKSNVIRAEYIRHLQEKNKALDEELASLREAFLQATRGGRVDVDEKD